MRRHTRPRFSPRIPVYGGGLRLPSAGAPSEEELCIFYLSPEIRLDPDENTGPPARTDACARRRAAAGAAHTNGPPSVAEKVGNYGARGEGQLGFAYVVERRNYISHKARRWK